MERVDMHVAMALGASVHPLTITTESVSTTVTNSAGFETTWFKNSTSDTVIIHPLSLVNCNFIDKFLTINKAIIEYHFFSYQTIPSLVVLSTDGELRYTQKAAPQRLKSQCGAASGI